LGRNFLLPTVRRPRHTDARIAELETEAEWDAAVPVLRQLWTDASEAFVRSRADEEEYRLFGCFVETDGESAESDDHAGRDEELVAVAGISVKRVLHHARHAWIHDLVVDEAHRGRGHGAELLSAGKSWAEERDCQHVALAVRDGNGAALDFYESEGMDEWGSVVETEL